MTNFFKSIILRSRIIIAVLALTSIVSSCNNAQSVDATSLPAFQQRRLAAVKALIDTPDYQVVQIPIEVRAYVYANIRLSATATTPLQGTASAPDRTNRRLPRLQATLPTHILRRRLLKT